MGQCACVYAADYSDNFPEFINSRRFRARKEHKCTECARIIQPGQEYIRDSGKWSETGFHSFKICLVCNELMDAFFCDGYSYGHIMGDLWDHIQEFQGISEECLAGLSPAAREVVCSKIENYWKTLDEEEVRIDGS